MINRLLEQLDIINQLFVTVLMISTDENDGSHSSKWFPVLVRETSVFTQCLIFQPGCEMKKTQVFHSEMTDTKSLIVMIAETCVYIYLQAS